ISYTYTFPYTTLFRSLVDESKAIRFAIEKAQWTCSLENYECSQRPEAAPPSEELSPNKRWAAFVKEHNLYLRDVCSVTVPHSERSEEHTSELQSLRHL